MVWVAAIALPVLWQVGWRQLCQPLDPYVTWLRWKTADRILLVHGRAWTLTNIWSRLFPADVKSIWKAAYPFVYHRCPLCCGRRQHESTLIWEQSEPGRRGTVLTRWDQVERSTELLTAGSDHPMNYFWIRPLLETPWAMDVVDQCECRIKKWRDGTPQHGWKDQWKWNGLKEWMEKSR